MTERAEDLCYARRSAAKMGATKSDRLCCLLI